MEFENWEPIYDEIVKEFGFSKEEDDRSAHLLHEICKDKDLCGTECLEKVIQNQVTICGYGLNLEEDLYRNEIQGTIIVADGATSILMENGIVPHLIVTDLDGKIEPQVAANRLGAVAVILAHGDNIEAIRRFVPLFGGRITPTTQGRPFDRIYNFGGFTDGDRAVMLARHFGAKQILLLGFDFLKPRKQGGKSQQAKRRKLKWASHLICDLNPEGTSLSTP